MAGGDLWSGEARAYRAAMRRRRRVWPWVLLLLVMLLAAFAFLYPRRAEGAPNACAAVERRAVRVALEDTAPPAIRAAARTLSRQGLNGQLVAPVIAERYRWLPTPMGCALAWWRLRWDGAEALGWVAGLRR